MLNAHCSGYFLLADTYFFQRYSCTSQIWGRCQSYLRSWSWCYWGPRISGISVLADLQHGLLLPPASTWEWQDWPLLWRPTLLLICNWFLVIFLAWQPGLCPTCRCWWGKWSICTHSPSDRPRGSRGCSGPGIGSDRRGRTLPGTICRPDRPQSLWYCHQSTGKLNIKLLLHQLLIQSDIDNMILQKMNLYFI